MADKDPKKPTTRTRSRRAAAKPAPKTQDAAEAEALADAKQASLRDTGEDETGAPFETEVTIKTPIQVKPAGPFPVQATLTRTESKPTDDQGLWVAIRNRTQAIGFNQYKSFIDRVLCQNKLDADFLDTGNPSKKMLGEDLQHEKDRTQPLRNLQGVHAYDLLRTATEVFLILECGVRIRGRKDPDGEEIEDDVPGLEAQRFSRDFDFKKVADRNVITEALETYLGTDPRALPYLKQIVNNLDFVKQDASSAFCDGVPRLNLERTCLLELIWSYWHEEGMLVQTLNTISLRFQNKRARNDRDPLAHLELDPLRPLSNLLWGYIQDEQHRLTVPRRAYEYEHHYGLSLLGKAVPKLRPADRRSKFLEAFHTLLHRAWTFFQEDADTTVVADGFPLLNGLKEVHMLLAEGAHNQFRDLPWTARVEMLIQQWLLARTEIRDFLRGRYMVPYREGWMAQVDALKKLKGWTDTSVSHFRDLGAYGEQILLSIRYGNWIDVNIEDHAKNWARYWKPEIQSYIHAYRAATGVDLSNADTLDFNLPAIHLRDRLAQQAGA